MKARLRVVPDAPAGVKPLLRWAGGKSWFVREHGDALFEHVVATGGRYVEPFLGGAAMALHLGVGGMILGDAEEDLITTYTVIRDEPLKLYNLLSLMDDLGTDREDYNRVRATPAHLPVEVAAKSIYLNRTCFNGLWRKNKKGEFNVPFGGPREMPALEHLVQVSEAIKKATLIAGDFQYVIGQVGRGDVVYCDPPYDGTHAAYTPLGFDADDQARLVKCLLKARDRGAEFYCHNSDTELVRDLWAGTGVEILETSERRAINSDGEGRGKVPCVLVCGVPG